LKMFNFLKRKKKNINLIKVIDSIVRPQFVIDEKAKNGEFTLRLIYKTKEKYSFLTDLYVTEFSSCILFGLNVHNIGQTIVDYFKAYHTIPEGHQKIGVAIDRRAPYNWDRIVILVY
jgi:hypothetical protein